MKSIEHAILHSWLNNHNISIDNVIGDFNWLFDKPTIKYISENNADLKIPSGVLYVPYQDFKSVSYKLKKKNSNVNIKFLIRTNKNKKYKVIYSKNISKLFVAYDDLLVGSEDIRWFDNLPKKCKILAYKVENKGIASETFLLSHFFNKNIYISKIAMKFCETEKKHIGFDLMTHKKRLSNLTQRVKNLNKELSKILENE